MTCGTGLDLLQSSSEFSCAVWAATASSATAASIGCTRNAVGSSAYYICTRCQGTARPLDSRPRREVQIEPDKLEVVASFCYLGDMLSAADGCELSTTTCENRLEEVQGAAASSLFTPPLFQDTRPCVQLLCAERNAPCNWDLAIDKAKLPMSEAEWQGNDQTDQQCQAARHCHRQVQWATCVAWHWRYGSHPIGEKASLVWTRGPLQECSQDSLWHTG